MYDSQRDPINLCLIIYDGDILLFPTKNRKFICFESMYSVYQKTLEYEDDF